MMKLDEDGLMRKEMLSIPKTPKGSFAHYALVMPPTNIRKIRHRTV
jgi:hypothetical protein